MFVSIKLSILNLIKLNCFCYKTSHANGVEQLNKFCKYHFFPIFVLLKSNDHDSVEGSNWLLNANPQFPFYQVKMPFHRYHNGLYLIFL
jgi:hypothetical protein